jgi:hypothetical protein
MCFPIYIYIYFIVIPKEKKKQQTGWPEAKGTVAGHRLVLWSGAGGMLLSHALQNDARHLQYLLRCLPELEYLR